MAANKQDAQTSASLTQAAKEQEPVSPWPGPKGMIPVTSGQADDANVHNRAFLDQILVEMRVIDAVEPDLTTTILGRKYASPLMPAAISHLNKVLPASSRQPMQEKAIAAKKLNLLNWIGMETNADYGEIIKAGGDTIRIIKPFADHERILSEIHFAEQHGAVAVGMDIDHVAGKNGKYDSVDGIPLGPVTSADLSQYAASTNLPFIAKGVLSVADALKAQAAGCQAIVVSHHHGRLPFGVPPLAVLPEIKKALQGSGLEIYADGSLTSGYDAYKALALGADAVLIGRGILPELLENGSEAMKQKLTKMNQQLAEMMLYTGVKDTKSFNSSVLHYQK